MTRYLYTSVTRIADLPRQSFDVTPLPKADWAMGDYVVGELLAVSRPQNIELPNGRMMEATEGDLVVGAFGSRSGTLETVGDWRAIEGGQFQPLTPAGLFGRLMSRSPFLAKLPTLRYCGHVQIGGVKQTMDGALEPVMDARLSAPIVLITGTSMSSGKTMSGRLVVSLLTRLGFRVVGAKLTGAARYRDVLSFGDAGAAAVFDFVDVGLPSTVVEAADYERRLRALLCRIAAARPDVVVAEAGASPLEPYNGKTAIDVLGDRVRFNLLCASDPYAVLGVATAFHRDPDLVAGGAANTSAGIALVQKLTGLTAMNLLSRASYEPLTEMLLLKLGLAR